MKGKSLEEVHESINTYKGKSKLKRFLAFLGPAYLISVGYMDPGNWATDIAGGAQFGYSLLWVLLMSNLMALLLQSLSARLGIVTQRDIAQASKESYPKGVNFILWVLAEIAIAACDLAEILGMAIGLYLLFDIPLIYGVLITVVDTFLLLYLINKGIRKLEAFIIALVAIIGLSFVIQMFLAKPVMSEVVQGFIPAIENSTALYIAIGIIGATVMPHNLYLHSSLVQTRKFDRTSKGIRQAIKYNLLDSTIALNLAFLVNAAILVLAASTFYKNGLYHVADIQDAYKMLEGLMGTSLAPTLFAIALIAAGQSSTVTGTLAGQIVMEGHLNLRIQPWVRRIVTRLIAIIPAVVAISIYGDSITGELLIFSQVILSMQLGFAIIPLIHFVSDRKKMKGFHIGWAMKTAAWLITLTIVILNFKLVVDEISQWRANDPSAYWWQNLVTLLGLGILGFLLYIAIYPLLSNRPSAQSSIHDEQIHFPTLTEVKHKNIAISVDFTKADAVAINHALQIGGHSANYTLIHVVETLGAHFYGKGISDQESQTDQQRLDEYKGIFQEKGYELQTVLAYGKPAYAIAGAIEEGEFDLLVMGAHGHGRFHDLLFGTTVERVRHLIHIPLYVVKR